jgi:hypothetical protein
MDTPARLQVEPRRVSAVRVPVALCGWRFFLVILGKYHETKFSGYALKLDRF